ncbi:MAG: helix-turn-helix transcriptional regulator [Bacilli bacterium]|nr:helix-turn-helix transcriptional regulator [Bacilli bacterium]
MINAYNKAYLHDVMRNIAGLFDLALSEAKMDHNLFAKAFLSSKIPLEIESGNPTYLCGKSSLEMLIEITGKDLDYKRVSTTRTPYYWAGWILSLAMWQLNKSFEEILSFISLKEIVSLYHPYHEAPIEKTVSYIASLFPKETSLKRIRLERKMTQETLSSLSGVNIRNIRSYEQKSNSISKASGVTLFALSKALGCKIEDLLESDYEK